MSEAVTAEGRYGDLEGARFPYWQRARDAARLTIPALIPPLGATGATKFPTPWQSTGARGVNNLSARLLLALFPPNEPFFRLEVSEFELEKITGQDGLQSEVDKALEKIERETQKEVETSNIRTSANEALKHLLVAGNALWYTKPKGGAKVYHIGSYVVCRDFDGEVLEIIVKEAVSKATLPDRAKAILANDDQSANSATSKDLFVYTWIKRTDKNWQVHQELKGQMIPGSKGSYPLDNCPWLPLRWTKVDGEDYGRGLVEEYQGDLQSLEGLMQAIVEGSAAAAKLLILVKPNGTTKLKAVAEAPSGAVREGNAEDVTFLQAQKGGDLSIASNTAKEIDQRLAYAFLLNSAIQRSGERVTAEEIRYMANEIDGAMGGIYSLLSQEFQLPLVKRLMFQMARAGKLPQLPANLVKPAVVTGLEALGRGNDLSKLDQFVQGLGEVFGPGAVQQWIIMPEYMKRRATALGINTDGLVQTPEQVQAQQQQQMMQQAGMAAVPHAVKAIGDIANTHAQANAAQAAGAPAAPQGGH